MSKRAITVAAVAFQRVRVVVVVAGGVGEGHVAAALGLGLRREVLVAHALDRDLPVQDVVRGAICNADRVIVAMKSSWDKRK